MQYAAFLRRGMRFGFRIGVDPSFVLRTPPGNLQSVAQNPLAVSRYIDNEVAAGKLFRPSVSLHVRRNPIGLIPKPHQPGKFRLIVDLSAPQGGSVNDAISSTLCSLQYASVEQAAILVRHLGPAALMAKLDLRSAYRMVPVHPDDQHLLGLEWQGVVYCDRALPFGLRSAPKLFTAVADGLAWAMHCRGIRNFIHYLDDFFFCGPHASLECARSLEVAVPLCAQLGLPVAPEKLLGPTTTITFLGIELDSVHQELRLPQEKLFQLRALLRSWSTRRAATKHQLQSLIDHMSHAAQVIRPGRTFMRGLIEAMQIPRRPFHQVRLNGQCRADLAWWALFVDDWNGVSFFPDLHPGPSVVADASGSWGCGAYVSDTLDWFQLRWPSSWNNTHIAAKELLPMVVSAALWGHRWSSSKVCFKSDNQATVSALNSRLVRDPLLMHLLRCLFFYEARFHFEHWALHVAGRDNRAADALSRNQMTVFMSLVPQAPRSPYQIPDSLIDMLLDCSLTWTSPRWRVLFAATIRSVSQAPP